MLDYVIRSGTVIDGTGEPGRLADVGIRDGRIVAVGQVEEAGETEFDAGGLVVMPGVVDPHTHYDAQLFWDPLGLPLQRARCDHGHRRELRVHARPDQRRRTPTTSAG